MTTKTFPKKLFHIKRGRKLTTCKKKMEKLKNYYLKEKQILKINSFSISMGNNKYN